jgi:hypothetical protein
VHLLYSQLAACVKPETVYEPVTLSYIEVRFNPIKDCALPLVELARRAASSLCICDMHKEPLLILPRLDDVQPFADALSDGGTVLLVVL